MTHKVLIHDKHGNVTGGFALSALLPLISTVAGPLLEKILGLGMADHISVPGSSICGAGTYKLHKKGGKLDLITPFIEVAHPFHQTYQPPHVQGGFVHPIQYGEVAYPLGGAAGFGAAGFGAAGFGTKKRGGAIGFGSKKKKHGGYAVDQLHSYNYTGFNPAHTKAMFPVNLS